MSPSTPRFVPEPPSGQVGVAATSVRQPDRALAEAVEQARAAAQSEAGEELVGEHVGVQAEDDSSATHQFVATHAGYVGWRWAVTVAFAGPGTPVTVSEVVLLPGPDALVAPDWLPWDQRVRAGDLGVGDLLPSAPDDPRLVPGYLASDDPAVEEVARELGLGRRRLLGRHGRVETARRWFQSDFGPEAQMARSAPAHCGTCGFYLPLAGSLRAAFGACGNEMAPADGRVVHAEYGCGAHSDAEVDNASPVPVAEVVFDDAGVELIPVGTVRPLGTDADADAADVDPAAAESPAEGTTAEGPAADGTAPESSTDAPVENTVETTAVAETSGSPAPEAGEVRPEPGDAAEAGTPSPDTAVQETEAHADPAAIPATSGEAIPDTSRPKRVRTRRGRTSAGEPSGRAGRDTPSEPGETPESTAPAEQSEQAVKPARARRATRSAKNTKTAKASAAEQAPDSTSSAAKPVDDGGSTT
ncbi:hypothetical protein FHR81_005100 [Actinoalloteichus hoggarensis]|uniref:Uncharacterized protein n=1 Tax=Actinoalloteichus hoggarensis TaxID=1470176 RepID=A0A221WAE9_9PSEU|nr:DUF3027 domain-containing protein [Actinoalloteichus hoggarensis]ASO22835.1 hypothetical protein AHOG_26150 [Actinoalloteichus hoggarensis]MBB5924023.1 hypothetical protein [Actinoalloteichus hoggarensis]